MPGNFRSVFRQWIGAGGGERRRPNNPLTLLLAHAIELYLKAFLRLRGVGIEGVKNSFGHDFKKLVDETSSLGLSLAEEDMDIAAILTEKESIGRSRYIETGCRHECAIDRTPPHRGGLKVRVAEPRKVKPQVGFSPTSRR